MTSLAALLIGVVLMLNDVSLRTDSEAGALLSAENWAANLVYLYSNCVLLKKLNIFPLQDTFHLKTCFLEIPVALLLLEYSVLYVWNGLQLFLFERSNAVMEFLSDSCGFYCFQCGPTQRDECNKTFSSVVIKLLSFLSLALALTFNKIEYC